MSYSIFWQWRNQTTRWSLWLLMILMSFSWIILQKGCVFKMAKRLQTTSIIQKLYQTTSSIVTLLMIIMLNNTHPHVWICLGSKTLVTPSVLFSPCYCRSIHQPCRSILHSSQGTNTTTWIPKDACWGCDKQWILFTREKCYETKENQAS